MTNKEIAAEAAHIREDIERLASAMMPRPGDAPVVVLLQNEVLRLRKIIDEEGMNHEPYIPEPEQFGPITERIWRVQQMVARSNEWFNRDRQKAKESLDWLSGSQWGDVFAQGSAKIGSTLCIRLPADFVVKQP